MEETKKKKFTPNQAFAACMGIRDRFRQSLLSIGQSPDTHVFDLEHQDLAYARISPERTFLIRVKCYYENLNARDRRMFLAEVLEKDRMYRFWYLSEYKDSVFHLRQRRLYNKVATDFSEPEPKSEKL